MFFVRKPKCQDINYIENMFKLLSETYSKHNVKNVFDEENLILKSYGELKLNVLKIASQLSINIEIKELDTDLEYYLNLPKVYNFNENKGLIEVTLFGQKNYDVAYCELLILIISLKIKNDKKITFDEDLIQNLEGFYRPFLLSCLIYFGYGNIFLFRNWIKGKYKLPNNNFLKYTYRCPIDLDTIIYGFSLVHCASKVSDNELNTNLKLLDSKIFNEINVCIKFFKKGNSTFFNTKIKELKVV